MIEEKDSSVIERLDGYIGHLEKLLRTVRAEKRKQREIHAITVNKLEEELHTAGLVSSGTTTPTEASGLAARAKLKEAEAQIDGLRGKLTVSQKECASLKDQMVQLFNAMVEMNTVPAPTPVLAEEIKVEMQMESEEEEERVQEEMKVARNEINAEQAKDELRRKLEKERKRRKAEEKSARVLEMDNTALKKELLEANETMKSLKADRDSAVSQFEELQTRVGSEAGRGLALLRKKHTEERDKLNRRLAEAQKELETLKKKPN